MGRASGVWLWADAPGVALCTPTLHINEMQWVDAANCDNAQPDEEQSHPSQDPGLLRGQRKVGCSTCLHVGNLAEQA